MPRACRFFRTILKERSKQASFLVCLPIPQHTSYNYSHIGPAHAGKQKIDVIFCFLCYRHFQYRVLPGPAPRRGGKDLMDLFSAAGESVSLHQGLPGRINASSVLFLDSVPVPAPAPATISRAYERMLKILN